MQIMDRHSMFAYRWRNINFTYVHFFIILFMSSQPNSLLSEDSQEFNIG